jgi:hypothetical protein
MPWVQDQLEMRRPQFDRQQTTSGQLYNILKSSPEKMATND